MRQNFVAFSRKHKLYLRYNTFYWNSSYKKAWNLIIPCPKTDDLKKLISFLISFCLFLGLPERLPEKGLQWWWFGTGIPWPGSTAGLSWRAGGWARTGIGEEAVEVVLGRVLAQARWLMSPFWSWSSPALSSKSVTQQLAAEKQIPKRILPGSTTVKST